MLRSRLLKVKVGVWCLMNAIRIIRSMFRSHTTNAGKLHILTPFFEHLAKYDMVYAVSGNALQRLVQ
jgi:hypothetical protein